MKTRIFYTTNAGLYFCSDTSEILIDGIHDAGSAGFCPMDETMIEQMKKGKGLFAGSGALLFTHLHRDHYDEVTVEEYIRMHPDTAIWGPGLTSRGLKDIEINADTCCFMYGDFSITAYRTRHSGSRTLAVPHYSLLLINEACGEAFFAAGDAELEAELASRIQSAAAGCRNGINVFVMSYQLAERKSKAFLEALSPSRIFLIHKPRPEDEQFSKVSRIMRYAITVTPNGVSIEEPEPMSWIE
ncbi:MAG: hypothetical protein IJH92_01980 [Mogibacterium sp.]|nr:hypothetical protein [Mogibacterium sp.]